MLDDLVQINELDRRQANLARIGTVNETEIASARARVRFGALTTDWLPWLASRAGAGGAGWHPPAPGEQVLVIAIGGDLEQGVIVGSLYQADHPAPDNGESAHTLELPETGIFRVRIGEAAELSLTKDGLTYSIGDKTPLALTSSSFNSDAMSVAFPNAG